MQTVVLKRVTQGLRNDLLAGDLFKGLRPPFSGYDLVTHVTKGKRIKAKG